MNPNSWIRISTAAKLLGLSRQHVHNFARGGKLRTATVDGMLFVSVVDVQRLKVERSDKNGQDEGDPDNVPPRRSPSFW